MSDQFSDDVCRALATVPAVQAADEPVGLRAAVGATDLAASVATPIGLSAGPTALGPGVEASPTQSPSLLEQKLLLARYVAAIQDWEKATSGEEQRSALAEAQRLWATLARLRGRRLGAV